MASFKRRRPAILLLAALAASACTTGGKPPPADFAITARTKPINPSTFEVFVDGTDFTPGSSVTISYASVPNRAGVQQGSFTPTVLPDGHFHYAESFDCTTSDPNDVGTVLVTARDEATGHVAFKNVPGDAWLCH